MIDYHAQRFEDVIDEVDLVFDLVGGDTQERSWDVLKQGGILVSTLTEPSQQRAADLIDAGMVKPVITRTYQLQEAAAAQEFLEHEHPLAKVVLSVH